MDKLSERLLALCQDYDGSDIPDNAEPIPRVTAGLLREAAALAKRYEDAPVYEVSALPGSNGGFGGVFTGGEFVGQSVRLLREPARRGG